MESIKQAQSFTAEFLIKISFKQNKIVVKHRFSKNRRKDIHF